MIYQLYQKYKEMILYIFFGVCTTAINTVCYYICWDILHIPNVPSTLISWVLAVIFAFVTNKYLVFNSKDNVNIVKEILSFFGCRIATGILDVAIMFLAVDTFFQNGLLWKIISNILVIILNYVASKFYIFKNK